MLLWILSDIHLELTRGWDLPSGERRPSFDVLVVAGDLIPKMERGVAWLLQRVPDKPVLYIAGNHEFYGCDIDRTVEKARCAAEGTNLYVLQNDAVTIDDVRFIGSTLWTDFSIFGNPDLAMMRAAEGLNDYHRIRKHRYAERLRPTDTLIRHIEACNFITRAALASSSPRKVVITHHGCVREAMMKGAETDILSAAYTSDRPDLLNQVDLWFYGHIHQSRDFVVSSTRLVSNPKGYGPWKPGQNWENPYFDPQKVVAI